MAKSINPWGYSTELDISDGYTVYIEHQCILTASVGMYEDKRTKANNTKPRSHKDTRDDYTPSNESIHILQSKRWSGK